MNNRRRAFLFLGGCVAASGVAIGIVPRHRIADERPMGSLESLIPTRFDSWVVDIDVPLVLPAPDVQAKLNAIYNQVLSRSYVNRSAQRIMLSIAYGGDQSDGLRAHRPEVCYSAQGFSTSALRRDQLVVDKRKIPVMRLVASLGPRVEPITYWVTIGTLVARTGLETKLAQLQYSTRGVIPDGLLMRVSSISTETGPSYRLHDEFINRLVAAVPVRERWRLVGA